MYILSMFTSSGSPASSLTPTVRVRNVATNALVATDAAMLEVGDGWYKYDFTTYDPLLDYAIRCDGGAALPSGERYAFAGTEDTGETTLIKADSTAILLDTGELQANQGNWITATGFSIPGSKMDLVDAPNALAIAVIQNGLATPTNITAGTITTATSVTNAVTISTGSGAGQLDIAGGVVKANLVQILGAAITGTAAQIVAAFSKFFDKASPTGTVNSLPDAVAGEVNGLAVVGSAMTLVDDLWGKPLPGVYALGTAGNILGNNLDVTVSSRLSSGSYASPPTAAAISAEVWAEPLDGTFTAQDMMRVMGAVLAGEVSGAEALHPIFKNIEGTVDVVDAETDADGNRITVSIDTDY